MQVYTVKIIASDKKKVLYLMCEDENESVQCEHCEYCIFFGYHAL
jgi:hypothetical protein